MSLTSMRRLLAFVQREPGISPGQRFRLEQWAPHLRERHGIELDFCAFESPALTRVFTLPGRYATKATWMLRDFWRRREAVRLAHDYDGAVVFREAATLGPAIYERVLARSGIPFVLDFDDAIWMKNPPGTAGVNGVFSRLRFPEKTATIARLASAVTVGNEFLARWAREHNDRVFVVPTSIELAKYPVQPELTSEDPFVIGWMGSFSTLRYLAMLRTPIRRFSAKRRTRVQVVCDRPLEPPFEGVETTFVRWHGDKEAEHIGGAHVGVMPLTDELYAQGKCGCKALQYMAAGRPAIVAPVGVNVDIVQHGKNGLLATTDDEWVEAFEKLASSPELRRELARAGRRTVEEGFTAERSAAAFATAVDAALSRGRGPTRAPTARTAPPQGASIAR